MAIILYIGSHLIRSFRWSVIALLIFVSLWFCTWYDSHISRKYDEIEAAYDNIPVRIELSNLNGTSNHNLSLMPHFGLPFLRGEFDYPGKTEQGFKNYLKDIHIETSMFYNVNIGKPRFDANEAKSVIGVFDIEQTYDFREMSGAVITYFDSFDHTLFLYDGGKLTEPTCIVPKECEHAIRFDDSGKGYINLLLAVAPKAETFIEMKFRVAGIHTVDNGSVYCPYPLVSAILT
ncbi:MAG: hypothetical protein Q4A41_05895, partial [Bacillota bacterium]|nr:hypothetical protein [Bacillota bacterium]